MIYDDAWIMIHAQKEFDRTSLTELFYNISSRVHYLGSRAKSFGLVKANSIASHDAAAGVENNWAPSVRPIKTQQDPFAAGH